MYNEDSIKTRCICEIYAQAATKFEKKLHNVKVKVTRSFTLVPIESVYMENMKSLSPMVQKFKRMLKLTADKLTEMTKTTSIPRSFDQGALKSTAIYLCIYLWIVRWKYSIKGEHFGCDRRCPSVGRRRDSDGGRVKHGHLFLPGVHREARLTLLTMATGRTYLQHHLDL